MSEDAWTLPWSKEPSTAQNRSGHNKIKDPGQPGYRTTRKADRAVNRTIKQTKTATSILPYDTRAGGPRFIRDEEPSSALLAGASSSSASPSIAARQPSSAQSCFLTPPGATRRVEVVVLSVISILLFALSFRMFAGLFRRRTNCAAANGTRLSANRPAHGMNSMSSNWGTSRVRSRGQRVSSPTKCREALGFNRIRRDSGRGTRWACWSLPPGTAAHQKEAGCCASHTRRAGLRFLISLAQPGPHTERGRGVRRLNESALQLPGPAGNESELWVHEPRGRIPVAVMGTNRAGLCPRASTRSLRLDQTRCCGRRSRRERSSTSPAGHAGKASRLTA